MQGGRRFCFFVGVIAIATSPARAQTSPEAKASGADKLPVYDVSTVKPNTSDDGNSSTWSRKTNYTAKNVPFRELLAGAFGLRSSLIFGLPPWAEKAHWDIEAKVTAPDPAEVKKLTAEQYRLMLQALYADRFALKWHYETRVLPALEIVVAKGGPKLKQATPGEQEGTHQNNTKLEATAVPLSRLADTLSRELHREVVDKTGLSGNYDYTLRWTSEEALAGQAGSSGVADAAPDVYTALTEQLGLRLQSGKDPLQVVVIDQCKPPSEN